MPKISVIIPCFNHGNFIHEAIESVLSQTFQDFEIIVVNDGSTDKVTNQILNNLDTPKIKVIHTANQGLAAARNNGIGQAAGEYILPLDADDKIAPTYLEEAVKILGKNENVGIVYCKAMLFGEESGEWMLPDYSFSTMLLGNIIFCSGFFRREDWKTIGGYRSNMIYGWEDYDFWLSVIELKREVYKIPKNLFYYRKSSDSMLNGVKNERFFHSYKQLVKNHKDLYTENADLIFEHIYSLRAETSTLTEEVLKLKEENSGLKERQEFLEDQLLNVRPLSRLLFNSLRKKIFSFRANRVL